MKKNFQVQKRWLFFFTFYFVMTLGKDLQHQRTSSLNYTFNPFSETFNTLNLDEKGVIDTPSMDDKNEGALDFYDKCFRLSVQKNGDPFQEKVAKRSLNPKPKILSLTG